MADAGGFEFQCAVLPSYASSTVAFTGARLLSHHIAENDKRCKYLTCF